MSASLRSSGRGLIRLATNQKYVPHRPVSAPESTSAVVPVHSRAHVAYTTAHDHRKTVRRMNRRPSIRMAGSLPQDPGLRAVRSGSNGWVVVAYFGWPIFPSASAVVLPPALA